MREHQVDLEEAARVVRHTFEVHLDIRRAKLEVTNIEIETAGFLVNGDRVEDTVRFFEHDVEHVAMEVGCESSLPESRKGFESRRRPRPCA